MQFHHELAFQNHRLIQHIVNRPEQIHLAEALAAHRVHLAQLAADRRFKQLFQLRALINRIPGLAGRIAL